MKDKYLIEKKENIFLKIFNYIKSFFNIKNVELESDYKSENINDNHEEAYKNWNDSIKIKNESEDVLALKEKFENNDINSMTLEELKQIGDLYRNKIKKLEEEINYNNATINLLEKKLSNN